LPLLELRPREGPLPLATRGEHPTFARASKNVAAVAMFLETLPTPSVDGVDRLYR
jgi:hypothetical protein